MCDNVSSTVLFEVHSVIGEHNDLGLVATELLNVLENFVERFQRHIQALRTLCMKQSIRGFEESEVVMRLRSRTKALVESLHVCAPDCFGSNVDQELKRQRFLIVQLIHVRRRNLVWRTTAQVFANASMQLAVIAIKIKTFVTGWRGRTKHRR